MRAHLDARRVLTEISLMLLIAVMMAAIGPFGTYLLGSLPVRLVYWLRTALAAYLLYRPGIALFASLAFRLGFAEAAGWVAAVVVLSAPMTLYLWFFGPEILLDRPWPGIEPFMDTYWQVIALTGPAMAVLWWRAAPARAAADPPPAPAPEAPAAEAPAAPETGPESGPEPGPAPRPDLPRIGAQLAERLPPRLGQEVIALQMEDHYVRVHTTRGEALVLMRMADAVAALAAVDGLRVHRSWWAARQAVAGVERKGRAVTLVLANGLRVPVARDRLPQLRERGWLEA